MNFLKYTLLISLICAPQFLVVLGAETPRFTAKTADLLPYFMIKGSGFEATHKTDVPRYLSGEWTFETVLKPTPNDFKCTVKLTPIRIGVYQKPGKFIDKNARAYFNGRRWSWLIDESMGRDGFMDEIRRAEITDQKPLFLGAAGEEFIYGAMASPMLVRLFKDFNLSEIVIGNGVPGYETSISTGELGIEIIEVWNSCRHATVELEKLENSLFPYKLLKVTERRNLCGTSGTIEAVFTFDDYEKIEGIDELLPTKLTKTSSVDGNLRKETEVNITEIRVMHVENEDDFFEPEYESGWVVVDADNGIRYNPGASANNQVQLIISE